MSNEYDHQFVNTQYYFGPYIYQGTLDPKFIEELIKRGDEATILQNTSASSLKTGNEKQLSYDNQKWFNNHMRMLFNHYIQNRMRFHGIDYIPDYILQNVWINYQHANEYQPEHTHAGDFSWVIYCKIPEGLEQEVKNYQKKSTPPGYITFAFGEEGGNSEQNYPWITRTHTAKPEVGTIFVFPSQLRHFVPPFTCDGVRISVSGNAILYKPDTKFYHMGEKRYEV